MAKYLARTQAFINALGSFMLFLFVFPARILAEKFFVLYADTAFQTQYRQEFVAGF